MAAPIISIRQARKSFGPVQALRGVDLEVESGEVVLIVGPSGSGKSTLLRAVNRLETLTSGEIWIDGGNVAAAHANIREIRREGDHQGGRRGRDEGAGCHERLNNGDTKRPTVKVGRDASSGLLAYVLRLPTRTPDPWGQ